MGGEFSFLASSRNMVDRNGTAFESSVIDMCQAGIYDLYEFGNLDPDIKFKPFLETYSNLFAVYDKSGFETLNANDFPIINYFFSQTDNLSTDSLFLSDPIHKYSKQGLLSKIQGQLDEMEMSCSVGMTDGNILEFIFSSTEGTTSRCVFINNDNTEYSISGYDTFTGIQTGGYLTNSFMPGFLNTSGLVSVSSAGGTISGLIPVYSITYAIPNQLSVKFNMVDDNRIHSYSFNSIIPSNANATNACGAASPLTLLLFGGEGGPGFGEILQFNNNPNITFPSLFDSYQLESSPIEFNSAKKAVLVCLSVFLFFFSIWQNDFYGCFLSILFFVFSVALETKSEPASNRHQQDIWTPDGYLDILIPPPGMAVTEVPRLFMSRAEQASSFTPMSGSMQSAPQPIRFSLSMVSKALKMYRASLSNEI